MEGRGQYTSPSYQLGSGQPRPRSKVCHTVATTAGRQVGRPRIVLAQLVQPTFASALVKRAWAQENLRL